MTSTSHTSSDEAPNSAKRVRRVWLTTDITGTRSWERENTMLHDSVPNHSALNHTTWGICEADNDLTYGEVEKRLDLIQEQMNRLELQMTTDIQAILQLLQRQSSIIPPAYSTVTASSEYATPAVRRVQNMHAKASIKTDRSFSPSSQSPDLGELEKSRPKSKESLTSGAHLNPTPEENLAPVVDHGEEHPLETHPRHCASYLNPMRHTSLPDSSVNCLGIVGLNRHESDPGLPGN